MNYTTAHELAKALLAGPDLPVFAVDGGSGVISEIGSPSVQERSEHAENPEDFGIEHTGPWVQVYTGK